MREASRLVVLVLACILFLPNVALAQRKLWGVTVSMSPVWQTLDFSRKIEGADSLALEGQTIRAGVSRGGAVHGGWSLLFVRRSLDPGGTISKDGQFTVGDGVAINGFEAEVFKVPGRINDRFLFGVVFAVGLGAVQGDMVTETGSTVPAKKVLTFLGSDTSIQPLVRLEFGFGVVLARGFRVRASGGFDWSGISGSVSASYFFGDR